MPHPSLYEQLLGNFADGLYLNLVSEEGQVILSVQDHMQRVINYRAIWYGYSGTIIYTFINHQ